jgi:hypothetical protein
MLAALIHGERDPKRLAELARTRLRAKLGQLHRGLHRAVHRPSRLPAGTMLGRVDQASADIAELDRKIDEALAPFRPGGRAAG